MQIRKFLFVTSIAMTTALTGLAHAADSAATTDAPVKAAQEMKSDVQKGGKKMASQQHHKAHKKISKKKQPEKHVS